METKIFNALRKIAAESTPELLRRVRVKADRFGDMSDIVLTAKVDDNIAGHLSIHPGRSGAHYIDTMWLHPKYRHEDVADALISAAEEEAAFSGSPLMFTQTRYIDGKPTLRDMPALLLLDKIKERLRRSV